MNLNNNDTISEERLLKLLKDDNLAAFDEIFNRYWNRLFISTQHMLNNKEVAEDVVQEVFVDLWERRNVVKVEKLSGYL